MTDKKKRGRPPGSKGKPKVEPFNPSKLDQEVKEVTGKISETELIEMATKAKGPDRPESPYDSVKMKMVIVDQMLYDPFKNQTFLKKMGLKDK